MSDPTPEQARAAVEWQAQESAAAARVDAQVAEFQGVPSTPGAAAPASVPLTPQQQQAHAQAQQVAALANVLLPKLGLVVVAVVDRLVQQYAGAQYALSEPEKLQIAEATGPVIQKYLPEDLTGFLTTPEGVLVATVVVIYGAKFLTANPTALDSIGPKSDAAPGPQPQTVPPEVASQTGATA